MDKNIAKSLRLFKKANETFNKGIVLFEKTLLAYQQKPVKKKKPKKK